MRWYTRAARPALTAQAQKRTGRLATEKLPLFAMIQSGGNVVIRMSENLQRVTIKPLIQTTIAIAV
jgi:hypothetical protein